mgnify:CR=1 FL=1
MNIFHRLGVIAFIAVFFILSLPAATNAQSRNRSYDRDAWEQWREQWEDSEEGDSDDGDEDNEERYSESRRTSSAMRNKINDLDEDAVDNIPIPILFGVEVRDLFPNFGDPRDGGSRSHEGFDIMAAEGTPIVSPTEAVVLRTSKGSSAGNYVTTANPGEETFVYMHLDEIADIDDGDVLKVGDIIGYVGNTGNASGGPAHLHLEIRDDDRDPTDPYPRLSRVFSLEDKMEYLEDILKDVDDEEEFAEFLVAQYRNDFVAARNASIELPEEIEDALGSSAGIVVTAAAGDDLTLGSQGAKVTALQSFLISNNAGVSARALANAGATGYFGPITQQALIEYQKSAGITPATGYYGATTRARILKTEVPKPPTASSSASETIPAPAGQMPTTDLVLGSRGSAVVWLQDYLIKKSVGLAAEDLKKATATGYFGAITQKALMEYQSANSITPSNGNFGPETRAHIAATEAL